MSSRSAADDERPISIGALSRATHIPAETLRTWERRYGSPRPIRKPSGHRLYPASAIDHLRRVEQLRGRGHRPAEILHLSARELDALLALSSSGPAPGADAPVAHEIPERSTQQAAHDLVEAARALDRPRLLEELRTAWVRFGPVRFLDEVAGPGMVAIGKAWREGTMSVGHEHLASACLSDFLRAVREPYEQRASGRWVVAAMLPGERHEGGLLMVSTLLALRGRRLLYLGADTPLEDIVAASKSKSVEAVVVSLSPAMSRAASERTVAQLREQLPSRVVLWIGGAGAPAPVGGVQRFGSLTALDAWLERTA